MEVQTESATRLFGGSIMSPVPDPYPVYKRLRHERPVVALDGPLGRTTLITRYGDVVRRAQGRRDLLLDRQRARHRPRHGPHHPRDGGQGASAAAPSGDARVLAARAARRARGRGRAHRAPARRRVRARRAGGSGLAVHLHLPAARDGARDGPADPGLRAVPPLGDRPAVDRRGPAEGLRRGAEDRRLPAADPRGAAARAAATIW